MRSATKILLLTATVAWGCSLVNAPANPPKCGDGVVAGLEECDDGNGSDTDACTSSCKLSRCGDGFVQEGKEACDDGNKDDTDACTSSCKKATCGDGFVQKDVEACDDGNQDDTDTCLSSCVSATCGDGVVQKSVEECDDKNKDNTDACTTKCMKARCGDGFVQKDVEECDDGNKANTDDCPDDAANGGTCKKAACGDGFVNSMGALPEECDDGNKSNDDDCPDDASKKGTCKKAACGDGFINLKGAMKEECDDGNKSNDDDCPDDVKKKGTCKNAKCGDLFVNLKGMNKEQCDDGNMIEDDGCTSTCFCGIVAGQWQMTGGWGIYTEAPAASGSPPANQPLPFNDVVFGTDGNRSKPYPGGETENSFAMSPPFTIPDSLDFEAWAEDEGGQTYDQKTFNISVDGGATFTQLLTCSNPNAAPFCKANSSKAADAWDKVSIPTGALAGQKGILKITYNTVDSCCGFERGFFMRKANFMCKPQP